MPASTTTPIATQRSPDPAAIAALEDLAAFSLSCRAACARITALNTLEDPARHSPDPVERRRAATTLLRACSDRARPARATDRPRARSPQPLQHRLRQRRLHVPRVPRVVPEHEPARRAPIRVLRPP